jgi:hypothetical protein
MVIVQEGLTWALVLLLIAGAWGLTVMTIVKSCRVVNDEAKEFSRAVKEIFERAYRQRNKKVG